MELMIVTYQIETVLCLTHNQAGYSFPRSSTKLFDFSFLSLIIAGNHNTEIRALL